MPRPRRAAAKKKKYEDEDEFDESEDAESDITESDFEDPDEMEVPMGGKNLKNMNKNGKGSVNNGASSSKASVAPSTSKADDSDDDIEVIGSTNGSSFPSMNRSRPTYSISQGNPLLNMRAGGDDDGFEIIKEVPGAGGTPYNNMMGNPLGLLASLTGNGAGGASSQLRQLMAQGGLSASSMLSKFLENGGSGMSSMMNPSANPYQALNQMRGGAGGMSAFSGLPGGMGGLGVAGGLNPGMLQQLYMQGGLRQQYSRMGGGEEDEEVAAEDEEDMGVIETYSNYKPTKLEIGFDHPDAVVETASLASVEPADVWYEVSIPEDCINKRKLSALQIESIVYASQQHEQFLPDGNRAGFLVGDGAGVGKGRTIAGIIMENFLKGRKRALWVSVSNDLKYDAERDLSDIGAEGIDVYFLSKMKYAKINSQVNGNVRKGVIFSTYSSLIGESQGGGKYKSRLKQLLHWCGDDFDGCIIFDECHKAKNLCPTGAGKPTKTGQTVLELQNALPKARVVYASATGASEPKHMAYMVRLGIWGPGSPFRDFNDFLGAVEKRGVGGCHGDCSHGYEAQGNVYSQTIVFPGSKFPH